MSSSNPPNPGQPVVTCCPSGVPVELRALPQFVNWLLTVRKDKPTKIPMQANSRDEAKANDPATWSTYEAAVAAWEANPRLAGIGFVFSEDDPLVGIDLDDCVMDGVLSAEARAIVDAFGTYAEISPSGTGLKLIGRGTKPAWARCKSSKIEGIKAVEVYDQKRFFTLTGNRVEGTPGQIADVQPPLDDLCERLWPQQNQAAAAERPQVSSPLPDDIELIEKMFQANNGPAVRALWEGNTSAYGGDESSADQALCNHLAFWTGRDPTRIDRLFRQSGLYREKWDRQDYRDRTIGNAIAGCTDTYTGKRAAPPSNGAPPVNGTPVPEPAPASTTDIVPLGQRDPATNRLVLSPKRTLPTGEAFEREHYLHGGVRALHNYADMLMAWRGGRYVEIEDALVRNQLQPWLHNALKYIQKRSGEMELVDFDANPTTLNAALQTVRDRVYLPVTTPSPSWLVDDDNLPPANELLPCRSALLYLPTNTYLPPNPRLFNINALDFDPDPEATMPEDWFRFLDQLFGNDEESVHLLQEWFGYCLTGDTSQQKMMLMVGPKRSGKGTIGRVLNKLVGEGNVCGPTTSSLAGNFGLQPLLGKSLAIVSDARFAGDSIQTVIERLLCISGEDALTVDRKHKTSVTMKLPTRFMFMSNELPRLSDASGALAGRFVILQMTKSFYGQEDRGLTARLLENLPGILNWSIEGWKRLRQRGHFVQPESVQDAMQELEDLGSPVGAFIRERCVLGSGYRIDVDTLYGSYRQWCETEGRQAISTKTVFGRDVLAAAPGVRARRNHMVGRFYEGMMLSGEGI